MDPSMDFWTPTAGLEKVIWLNRSNKSIYEAISKRIADSQKPRDLTVNAPVRNWFVKIP